MPRRSVIALVVLLAAITALAGAIGPARAGTPPRIELSPDNNDKVSGPKGTTKTTGGPMAGPGAAGGAALGEDAATTTCAKEASTPACDVTTVAFSPRNVRSGASYWDERSGTLRVRIDWQDPSGSSDLDMYVFRRAYPGETDEEGEPVTSDVFVIASAKDNTELGQPGPAKWEELNVPEPVPNEYYVYVVSFNGQVPQFTGVVELTTGVVRTFDRTNVTARPRVPTKSAEGGTTPGPLGGASERDFLTVTPTGAVIRTDIGREAAQANPGSIFVGRGETLRLRGASVRRVPEGDQTVPTVLAVILALALVGGATFWGIRRYRRQASA